MLRFLRRRSMMAARRHSIAITTWIVGTINRQDPEDAARCRAINRIALTLP
jgi:hypothetical protein